MKPISRISFEGQVGLVTGAAGGLGLAYSRLLAERGAHVVMHDVGAGTDGRGVEPQRIQRSVEALLARGLSVQAVSDPIDHRAGCHALVQNLLQQHGRIDFLIHNAGWVEYQTLEAIEDNALEQMLSLAAKTPLWLAQAAWPAMRAAGGGRIVITTSDRALYPQYAQRGLSAYAMGKLAALGLVNVLALEGAEHGIVVNAVSPVAKTRMWGIDGEPDELHPDAVAQGVAYLASTRCQDGGWVLRASNGQFHALRLQEAEHVAYPRDLRAVSADSIESVALQWPAIARASVDARS
ncbi:SDR family NAD(P)-dependent oxidoreductase [Stenotrophomonas maltophilia]|uniref:SDR family NAD(P)-dependent oxidoreductase n=1 Tax=Stenotrophomonas maltophilia TaxID=40324 RepID=UPI0002C52842|nr:SDR family NAD(P)-dependent oxidoreductase [Stenotrophomonas maltophilia]MBA0395753.1 SDR family NAD(P)-dependent oxidoreductase [Stenotrophomonas maltophilia]QGL75033.1 SDR family NAD(P)-dependent oxidoreductase [Stenotrophomonas maltophilia]CCP15143.1 Peroxisomal hydratase-dehydrogenase-epimerase [Stenotrophomonas maltophilia RA8]